MPGLILGQLATLVPGGKVELDDSLYLTPATGSQPARMGVRLQGADPSGTISLHKSTHHEGGADALDLDSIAGVLDAAKLHGSATIDVLAADYVNVSTELQTDNLSVGQPINWAGGGGQAPIVNLPGTAQLAVNFDADKLDGQHGSFYRDANNINAGTLDLARGGTDVDATALAAGLVFAAPAAAPGAAAFRALAETDVPSLTSGKISDFAEAVQDIVGAFAAGGTNIDVVYNDASNTLTFNLTGTLAKANQHAQTAYLDVANVFTSSPTAPNWIVNGAAGSDRRFLFRTSGVDRWFAGADTAAESGSNAGSNFYIRALSDAGALIGNAVVINRATMAATFAAGVTITGTLTLGTPTIRSGSGTPEGVVTAPVGSLFLRTNGGASTTLYVKETGTGNTGWRAV